MKLSIVFLIILSFATALILALFQYVYKVNSSGSRKWILTALRTTSLFLLFVLLINPKIETSLLSTEKPKLIVAIDNSSSMRHLKVADEAADIYERLKAQTELQNKFDIRFYKFGSSTGVLSSLDFQDTRTDFSDLMNTYTSVYDEDNSPMVLITDGNQTYGNDISYRVSGLRNQIYPIVLGDTTAFEDLAIDRVNHNRYVFHKNKFQVELFLSYSGEGMAEAQIEILSKGQRKYASSINFNQQNTSEIISAELTASDLGVQNYKVVISSLDNERNVINNSKEFAIEVIDQTTNVAIVYGTPHPDIGMFRKSIMSNEQRKVFLLQPDEYLEGSKDFQLLILFQPDERFREVLKEAFSSKQNTLLVAGALTDWELINSVQSMYQQEITYQEEQYQPIINRAYSPFITRDIDFEDYPPLLTEFGEIRFNSEYNTLLYKSIRGTQINQPLLATIESNDEKHGILLGEGSWRWRAQNYIDTESFEMFDTFMGKLVQYLSSNKRRKRLVVDYKSFYNSSDEVVIAAQFFNKSFELDKSASLLLTIENSEAGVYKTYPLLFGESEYKIDLSGLPAGTYQFELENKEERITQSGSFKIIPYDVEKQFISPNVNQMELIAQNTDGQLYNYQTVDELLIKLLESNQYRAVQSERTDVSPIIDWYYLLGLIALALSLEWFIRKYNGLI
jgi:hypothetical protein